MSSSLQNFSNSYEWGSSWRTTWKAHLCKTWLRLITSPLSPGSDELLLLRLKASQQGNYENDFLSPTHLSYNGSSPCDVTAVCCPRLAWEAAENLTQEKNTDVTKALLTYCNWRNISINELSLFFFNWFPWSFSVVELFVHMHPPPCTVPIHESTYAHHPLWYI